jgi:hypothetical protein
LAVDQWRVSGFSEFNTRKRLWEEEGRRGIIGYEYFQRNFGVNIWVLEKTFGVE